MGTNKKGSVMVVGAGIAGIQASLDLAESGYYVHLVESSSAIGGTMPMLDKTFPTNDCSMCILSPKLVECGRHLNVNSHTCSDILDVQGEPGNFKVKIRKRPRYIEADKCKACNECADACPVEVPNEYNQNLDMRKAVFKKYAQAFPNAFVIDKRGTSPCKAACPAGVNVQGYVQLIKKGKFDEAWRMVYRDNPFPAACGRICTHPCQAACHRGKIDEPVSIMALKRAATDFAYENAVEFETEPVQIKKDEKVAVVGAGPAGLSAAYQLIKKGYQVTVFEALPVAGGMLRVGIPEYRLPKKWVDTEVELLVKMGVEIKYNQKLGTDFTTESLLADGYKAVFVGIGAHKGTSLNIPGEDLAGVSHGLPFLRKLALGEEVKVGKKVAVIGGGNTAMDCARTAVRLGAEKVSIIYRRTEAEITAAEAEIKGAKEEGIDFLMLTSPKAFLGEGQVTGIECLKNELGEPDASGRRRPVAIEGSEFILDVDTVILAVGQKPDLENISMEAERGILVADADTLATNIPGVFAGGDAVTGPKTVVAAIGAGKAAAESIHRYIMGIDLAQNRRFRVPEEDIAPLRQKENEVAKAPALPILHLDPAKRAASFIEESLTCTLEEAQKEAKRCLNCGVCSECLECEKACMSKAVNHYMEETYEDLEVGAILLCPGFEPFDPRALQYYGYEKYTNVLTSLEFERILSASGPYQGHLVRPSDHKEPKRIAWIQCVGSRNVREGSDYCSSVCCMYAVKEAMIAKEHSKDPLDTTIFYMDMRTYGKGFEAYYNRAKDAGVNFVRSRIFAISDPKSDSSIDPELLGSEDHEGDLLIRYSDEKGQIHNEIFDMVILSVGLKPRASVWDLAAKMGVELNADGFCEPLPLTGVETNRPGIYVAGAFGAPADIPETVMQASAAVGAIGGLLADARGTLVKEKVYPPEIDVRGEEPRIGVFVCHCGINIGSVVNVPEVVEMAKTLPNVVYAEDAIYTCSQDNQVHMKEVIKEHNINRVVVASCSPRTHKPLFQETLLEGGLNRFLFEMANIRDQCSWVHQKEPEKATAKAKDLVKMIVAKAALLQPIHKTPANVTKAALIIGGGVAGLNSAVSMSKQGFDVHVIEKTEELGGMGRKIYTSLTGEDMQAFMHNLTSTVENDPKITVHKGTEVNDVSGYLGNFTTTLTNGEEIKHGVAIIATGGQEYTPTEYLYGQNDKVLTHLQMEEALFKNDSRVADAKNVVFIQCVGSRQPDRPYCSRFCCTKSIKLALDFKEKNPKTNVFILYRDIRSYGMKEKMYTEARNKGVIFIRYEEDQKPLVEQDNAGNLLVTVLDHVLQVPVKIQADVIGLATAVLPAPDNSKLSSLFKIPINDEGFFLEAHMKLRPVDFASEGIFMAGLAHAPKNLDENIAQSQAAVGRVSTILAKDKLLRHNVIAVVQPDKCAACYTCVRLCPFNAPRVVNYAAQIEPLLCQGCGTCAGECPNKAITLQGYTDKMYMSMVDRLCEKVVD